MNYNNKIITVFRALLLLIFGMQFLPAQVLPVENTAWFQARSAHFRIYSQIPEQKAKEIVNELEILREIFLRVSPDTGQVDQKISAEIRQIIKQVAPNAADRRMALDGPKPLHLFFFKDQASVRPYNQAGFEIGGLFNGWGVSGSYIIVVGPEQNYAIEAARHEYMHHLMKENFPRIPLWLNEGIAEFYSTVKREQATITFGIPNARLNIFKSRQPMSVDSLMRVTNYNVPDIGNFYASSWLVVHRLLTNPNTKQKFWNFLKDIETGVSQDRAFVNNFRFTPAELDVMVSGHVKNMLKGGSYWYEVVNLKDLNLNNRFNVSNISKPDILARLGIMSLHLDKAYALRHFDRAVSIDPRCSLAVYGRGLAALSERRIMEADKIFIEIAPGCLDESVAQCLAGDAYLKKYKASGGNDKTALQLAIKCYTQSIKAYPTLANREAIKGLRSSFDDISTPIIQKSIDNIKKHIPLKIR